MGKKAKQAKNKEIEFDPEQDDEFDMGDEAEDEEGNESME